MTGGTLLFLLFGLALVAWLSARARAAAFRAPERRFSSLPAHFAWYVALWTLLPPLAFLGVWALTSPALVTDAVAAANDEVRPTDLQLVPRPHGVRRR